MIMLEHRVALLGELAKSIETRRKLLACSVKIKEIYNSHVKYCTKSGGLVLQLFSNQRVWKLCFESGEASLSSSG